MSGIVIGYLGQEFAYFINAVTFLAVIFALIALGNVPQQQSKSQAGLRAAFMDIRAGLQFIRRQPLILSTMILDFIATFFASANTLLPRSEEHTSELQSPCNLVCRLLLEKK